MNIRFQLGNFLKKCGYRMARDHRWPTIHGNLLYLGFSLLSAKKNGPIQVLQIGAFDGHASDPLEEILSHASVSAVLVEPQTTPYELLVSHYTGNPRIRLVNAAVGESDGHATLYVPSSEASPKASLLAQHHNRFGAKAGSYARSRWLRFRWRRWSNSVRPNILTSFSWIPKAWIIKSSGGFSRRAWNRPSLILSRSILTGASARRPAIYCAKKAIGGLIRTRTPLP